MTRTQIALAGVAALYLLALRGCYEIVPFTIGELHTPGVYRVNRITGSAEFCVAELCRPLIKERP